MTAGWFVGKLSRYHCTYDMTSEAIEMSPFIYQFAVVYSVFAYSMIAVKNLYNYSLNVLK